MCKGSKIKQPKPTQNSEVCTVQLGLNQYIFVREQITHKGKAQPKDKNREERLRIMGYVYKWLITSLPEEASDTQNHTLFKFFSMCFCSNPCLSDTVCLSPTSRVFLLLYTPQHFTSWPLISTYPNSPHDTYPLKLLMKVIEGATQL